MSIRYSPDFKSSKPDGSFDTSMRRAGGVAAVRFDYAMEAVVAAAAKLLSAWEPRDGDADGYAEREELRLALEALAKETK